MKNCPEHRDNVHSQISARGFAAHVRDAGIKHAHPFEQLLVGNPYLMPFRESQLMHRQCMYQSHR